MQRLNAPLLSPPQPLNFFVLSPGDGTSPQAAADLQLCSRALEASRAGDAAALAQSFQALAKRPVAVEVVPSAHLPPTSEHAEFASRRRSFVLPARAAAYDDPEKHCLNCGALQPSDANGVECGTPAAPIAAAPTSAAPAAAAPTNQAAPDEEGATRVATVRELPFEAGGLGHCVWEAGVALSVWLARNAEVSRHAQRAATLLLCRQPAAYRTLGCASSQLRVRVSACVWSRWSGISAC